MTTCKSSSTMDRPLLIRRRQRLSCLLITALTILLSLTTLATCASVETTQGSLHYKLQKTDNTVSDDHRTFTTEKTKDTSLYRNHAGSLVETLTKNIGQTPNNPPVDPNSHLSSGSSFLKLVSSINNSCWNESDIVKCVRDTLIQFMRNVMYEISHHVRNTETDVDAERNSMLLREIIPKQLRDYDVSANLGGISNQVDDSARAALSWFQPEGSGKSSFLTGFGLGFLAFGLKKLLLPLFLGAQIVKSVLIAMFLPSILGGLGKLVGKGVSTFAGASGSSGPSNNNVDDFDFKDNMGFENGDSATADSKYSFTYPETYGGLAYQNTLDGVPAGTLPGATLYMPGTAAGVGSVKRYQQQLEGNSKVSYESLPTGSQHHYGSYYTRHQQPNKRQDYKVFHKIPQSSLLLTNYDPFYSPLLSRLDSVFKQLGYETETCRERLVCAMYNNPAKFAPFSNLVSAQLSRDLNELRKPSTDNPEILRFFRYMKAAKDGQDGQDCIRLHPGCSPSSSQSSAHPPMIKTYHDINKLVQARRLGKAIGVQENSKTSTALPPLQA